MAVNNFSFLTVRLLECDGDEIVVSMSNEIDLNGDDSDDDYDEHGSEYEDEELLEVMQKRKQIHEELVAELEAITAENNVNMGGDNAFDVPNGLDAYYQDSDNANSPLSSEEDNNRGMMEKKEKAIS